MIIPTAFATDRERRLRLKAAYGREGYDLPIPEPRGGNPVSRDGLLPLTAPSGTDAPFCGHCASRVEPWDCTSHP